MSDHEVESAAAESAAVGSAAVDGTAVPSQIADALAELDTLAERDLTAHPEVFERIHGQLHAALSAIDDA